MANQPAANDPSLERFRSYLHLLASLQLTKMFRPQLGARVKEWDFLTRFWIGRHLPIRLSQRA
jgi:hypothetical protein